MRRAITHIHTFTLRQHLSAESLPGIDCTFRTVARACFPVVTCRQSSTHGRQPQGRPCATSVHTRYCLPLSTPPNQQTPRNHCASYAIPSRWERRRDPSWHSRRQSSGSRQRKARRPPTSVVQRSAARPQQWYTLASYRSLSTSARSYSSPRRTWALTRGIVRGRVVLRHGPADRPSLGRLALASSAPRPPPTSCHTAGFPAPVAPAVGHRFAAASRFSALPHRSFRCRHRCRFSIVAPQGSLDVVTIRAAALQGLTLRVSLSQRLSHRSFRCRHRCCFSIVAPQGSLDVVSIRAATLQGPTLRVSLSQRRIVCCAFACPHCRCCRRAVIARPLAPPSQSVPLTPARRFDRASAPSCCRHLVVAVVPKPSPPSPCARGFCVAPGRLRRVQLERWSSPRVRIRMNSTASWLFPPTIV